MAAKLVQGERKRKFICSFPSRRLIKNYVKHRLKFLKPSGEQNKWIYFFFRGAVYLHGVSVKIVQGERNAKSQRENIEGKFIFTLLSKAEIQFY